MASVCLVHTLSASLTVSIGGGGSQEPPNWFLKLCGELGILHPDAPLTSLPSIAWSLCGDTQGRMEGLTSPYSPASDSVHFCPVPCLGWPSQGRGGVGMGGGEWGAPALCVRLQSCSE